ncbi:hypothetical protein OJF2_66720 [Aquisphaera giovannonii]|uniref:Uncharacterized protein n=1 Tax=Aquisphaera giovannonii TaxID=406548 RepID=A0A5B9WCS4_9BACT|nr:hypothetical protein [Aquisphaera giovannonii]QEH38074.1 hypothetical protein OJF2_66720 [Aquisphaera giovannonii]
MILVLSILLASSLSEDPPAAASPGWRFVLPPAGDGFEHPPFRAIVLSREKPEDVAEKASYRGANRRYAQVRFGSPGSIRVTVVLDEVGPGDAELYVDANRDRRIDDRDRVAPAASSPPQRGRTWRLPLDVAMVEGEHTRMTPRAVAFRLGATGRTLGYAAAGYVEGTVVLGDDSAPRAVRRMDGDGNGLLSDPQDRIWLDLNGDGRWDGASEQFLFATVLNLGGSRYVLRSDTLGTRLAFEPLVGTGTVKLAAKAKGTITELHATLVGRDGSAYGLSADESAVVPVGEYRFSTVSVTLDDPGGGPAWSFLFSDNGAKGDPRWYAVGKDQVRELDPLGALEMAVSAAEDAKSARAGEDLTVQPALYTGDGLLINVGYRGTPASPGAQEAMGATTTLATAGGEAIGSAHSGFA